MILVISLIRSKIDISNLFVLISRIPIKEFSSWFIITLFPTGKVHVPVHLAWDLGNQVTPSLIL
jgi:hypothetical protein